MDVSEEILRNHLLYGSSDDTDPTYYASNRTLNYTTGGSIHKAEEDTIQLIPFTIKYRDTVGLFGAENYFSKIIVKLDRRFTDKCYEERGWECARMEEGGDSDTAYDAAIVDFNEDLDPIVNTYEPAKFSTELSAKPQSYISVHLDNLKTGNIYIDSWLDTRLYTADREEHPYDKMYVRENDFFYVGFHARNTRRLPYNVTCLLGDEYVSYSEMTEDDRRYI